MRKHSVRKWIHAICDLLPLLVIPIFALAVRSDNNFTPIEVQQDKYEVVNFNQLSNIDYENNINVNFVTEQYNYLDYKCGYVPSVQYNRIGVSTNLGNLYNGHKYLIRLDLVYNSNKTIRLNIGSYVGASVYLSNETINVTTTQRFEHIYNMNQDVTNVSYFVFADDISSNENFIGFKGLNVFDLTQMFGVGNEPSVELFDIWYPNNFYDYDVGTKQLLNVGTETLNDTDVGSQMVYTLYNTCDKYFNFNNVGVFQDLYNWFELNLFNGTAPMSFYIVWNVILFEFIMDLIFLTYMVFMFIIDFTECMIDRFFEKSYRGGR